MRLYNISAYTTDFTFAPATIYTHGPLFAAHSSDDEAIDGHGLLAIPGLVDIHFHGAYGHDFMEGTPEALSTIARYEASCGVTAIHPATMTMAKEDIVKACANARNFVPQDDEASLLGIYMEGPFVSPHKVGAQNPHYVLAPSVDFFTKVQQAAGGLIKVLAIAPEEPGALDTIAALQDKVRLSIAHTCADYDITAKAFAAGALQLTHLYNAMPPLVHRAPGPIAAGADSDIVSAEIICDGIHIHPAAVRVAFKLFGAARMILISDSMMAVGLPNGEYSLGGQRVFVTDRKATLESGTIAGSATNLFTCMQIAHRQMGLPLETVIRAATYNPAAAVGALARVGTIEKGKEASLLLIDKELNLKGVLLRGKWLKRDF